MKPKLQIEKSELRNGYIRLLNWLENGMSPPANIYFTEGDCRIAGQLMEMTKSHFLNEKPDTVSHSGSAEEASVATEDESKVRTPLTSKEGDASVHSIDKHDFKRGCNDKASVPPKGVVCPSCHHEIFKGETTITQDNIEYHSGCFIPLPVSRRKRGVRE